MKQKPPGPETRWLAFSLVEVTMAIGIFAFAIVAVLGLLAISMNSDKAAASDTVLALVTQTTTTRLRNQPFALLAAKSEYGESDSVPDFFYDADGNPTTLGSPDSYYNCRVALRPTSSSNVSNVMLEFRWPGSAPAVNQESRFVTLSVARYE